MKKIFLSVFFLAFPFSVFRLPQIPEIPKIISDTSFVIYSDEALTKKEVNFSAGQIIYVGVKIVAPNEVEATLTLLDSDKSNLKNIPLTRKAEGFFTDFSAPQKAGTYYLHLDIKGGGFNFSGERNITVIRSATEENKAPVRSEAKSIVSTSEKSLPVDFLSLIRTWIDRFLEIFTKAS